MNFFIPDIARTPEDFERASGLISRLAPSSPMPPIGQQGNVTYVLRDEKNRSVLLGVAHVEFAAEVQCLIVDPDYKDATRAAYMMLHRGMEMDLRKTPHSRYYMTVPESDQRVIKIFDQDGAERMDAGMVRFMKRL